MPEGRIHTVKSALLELISQTDASLQPRATHVLGNWRLNVWNLTSDKFPIVTVRLGPSSDIETAFGRRLSRVRGQYVVYTWSAHVFAYHSAGEELVAKAAMDLADLIKIQLAQACDAAAGIPYIYDMIIRESEPSRGSQRISRIIIEGKLIAKKPFTV